MNIKIGNKTIGEKEPVFIVAELSANHIQDFDVAVDTIHSIKDSSADAVKFQTFTPDTITVNSDKSYFQIEGTLWHGRTLHDLYKEAYMPWEWQPELKRVAEKLGLACFSSPFDKTAVDFLEKMDVPAYKIASFEITDVPLIEYTASKGKPIIISTGIAELCDIEMAVNACKRAGNQQIILLKCTSSYPAPLESMNLKTIPNMVETFNKTVGLSDHTIGSSVAVASVALGAKLIEKHFILDKSLGGPDCEFSAEPEEFKVMVKAVRDVEKALGDISYDLTEDKMKSRNFSRSLFVVSDMAEGDEFTDENIRSIRPGYGLHPKHLKNVLGKRARKHIEKGTPLTWDLIS